jgi:hypothetical protein
MYFIDCVRICDFTFREIESAPTKFMKSPAAHLFYLIVLFYVMVFSFCCVLLDNLFVNI